MISVILLAAATVAPGPRFARPGMPSLSTAAAVADTVRGRVVDGGGGGVAGARVTVTELGSAVTTGDDGRFALVVPRGRYTIIVESAGFATATRDFDSQSGSLDLSLQTSPFRMDPVNVTVTRQPSAASESSLPVSSLGQETLRREHNESLARAVSTLAGVHAITTGEQIGKPVLRGLSGPRVLVLENGHRLEDYSWSDEDGPSIDSRLAQRVEIIRGPASVLYGSDAIGGVINAVPAPLPDATLQGRQSHKEIEVYGGSNNMEVGTAARYEGASGRFGWRGFMVGRFAEDLRTPAGKLDNTGYFALNGEMELGINSRAGTSVLRYSRYGGEFKLLEASGPVPGTQQPEEEGGPERKLSDDRVQFDGNYGLGGMRLETKAQWQRHFISELSDDLTQPGGPLIETEVFNLVLNTLTADVLLHHGNDALHGTVGGSLFHQGNDTRGEVPLVPDGSINSVAGFAFEQLDAGRLSLLGGARVEHRGVSADANADLGLSDESRSYNVAVGNVGAVLHAVEGVSFTANAGRAWRAPNLFEMFTNGPRLGEARYEIGDPDLAEETSLNLDGSVRIERPRFRGELAAYHNRIDNYIFVTPTNQTQNGLRVYRYEQADATLVGGEASAEAQVASALTVRGRYDVVKATNDETDEPLPLIPPRSGAVEAELHKSAMGWAKQAYFGVEAEIIADKTRFAYTEEPTAGYTLFNFEAGVQRDWGSHTLRVDLRVRNAFDKDYRSFLSRYKEFASDPGRNIMIRLSTDF
jgi:iron complex outermembrane recepter protein